MTLPGLARREFHATVLLDVRGKEPFSREGMDLRFPTRRIPPNPTIIHLLGLAPEGWLASRDNRGWRPLGQPVHLSAIEHALRGRGTDSIRSGMSRATVSRTRIV
jgi:hypothetical protein